METTVFESTRRVYMIGSFVAIGGFMFGYQTTIFSGLTAISNRTVDGTEIEYISNNGHVPIFLGGAFLGSLIAGKMGDALSRIRPLGLFSLIFLMACIPALFCDLSILYIIRFVPGIAIGVISVLVPIYQSEIATYNDRGKIVLLQQISITFGIAISFLTIFAIDPIEPSNVWSWRTAIVVQIIPALILCAGFYFLPSSPRWLMLKNLNNESEAKNILLKLRAGDQSEVEQELSLIKREIRCENQIENDNEQELVTQSSQSIFRHPSLRRRLFLGIGIQIFSQLTGINSIMYYGADIFETAGFNKCEISIICVICGFVNFFFTLPVAYCLIDKFGRQVLLIFGTTVMALCMLVIGIKGLSGELPAVNNTISVTCTTSQYNASSIVIVVFVCIFIAAFAVSMGPIQWIYCAEIFPLTKRAIGTSLTTAAHWLANLIVSLLAPYLFLKIRFGIYMIFSSLCVAIGISVYLFYPETRGVSLEEMDELFRGPKLVCLRSNRRLSDNTRSIHVYQRRIS